MASYNSSLFDLLKFRNKALPFITTVWVGISHKKWRVSLIILTRQILLYGNIVFLTEYMKHVYQHKKEKIHWIRRRRKGCEALTSVSDKSIWWNEWWHLPSSWSHWPSLSYENLHKSRKVKMPIIYLFYNLRYLSLNTNNLTYLSLSLRSYQPREVRVPKLSHPKLNYTTLAWPMEIVT